MLALRYFSFLCVLSVGCSMPNAAFVGAVDSSWKAIGPEYALYVERDPALSPEQKATRLRTCKLLSETIQEAVRK